MNDISIRIKELMEEMSPQFIETFRHLHNIPDSLLHIVLNILAVVSYGAVHSDFLRRYVIYCTLTGLYVADGYHTGVNGTDITADDSLEGLDNGGCHNNGVNIFLRHSSMAALARNLNIDSVYRGHKGSFFYSNTSVGDMRFIVHAEDSVDVGVLHTSQGNQLFRSQVYFFRRLEEKLYRAF